MLKILVLKVSCSIEHRCLVGELALVAGIPSVILVGSWTAHNLCRPMQSGCSGGQRAQGVKGAQSVSQGAAAFGLTR